MPGTESVVVPGNPIPVRDAPPNSDPSVVYDAALDGVGLAASIIALLAAPETGGLSLLAVAGDLFMFLESAGAVGSLPSQDFLDGWAFFTSQGLAPGSVYISHHQDGSSFFDLDLNSFGSFIPYQITWSLTNQAPIIEFFDLS